MRTATAIAGIRVFTLPMLLLIRQIRRGICPVVIHSRRGDVVRVVHELPGQVQNLLADRVRDLTLAIYLPPSD